MNEDLREAIERAKLYPPMAEAFDKICESNNIIITEGRKKWNEDFRQTLRLLIHTAEQVLEAGEELPEKKKLKFNSSVEEYYRIGFNEALSLCLPILAKKNLRISKVACRS